MEDKLKTKLLTMHVGEKYDNSVKLSDKEMMSYGLMWVKEENVWIKVFR